MDLVIAGGPDPGLVRGAAFKEAAPRVPAGVILIGIVIRVREVSDEENSLAFSRALFVVGERLVGVEALSEIADQAEDVRCVRAQLRRRPEPEAPRRLPYAHGVIILGVVLQERDREYHLERGGERDREYHLERGGERDGQGGYVEVFEEAVVDEAGGVLGEGVAEDDSGCLKTELQGGFAVEDCVRARQIWG